MCPHELDAYLTFAMGNLLEQIIKIYYPVLSKISPSLKILIETNLKRSSTECEQVTDISGLRRDHDCCHGLAHLRQIRQKIPDEFQNCIPITKEFLLVLLSSVQYLGMPGLIASIV